MSIVLIYDGECGLCGFAKDWIEKNALPDRIELLPCQSPKRFEKYPMISTEKCMAAIQLVLPDKRVLEGAEALPEIMNCMKRWRWMEKILRTRFLRKISPVIYELVAQHRNLISCAIKA